MVAKQCQLLSHFHSIQAVDQIYLQVLFGCFYPYGIYTYFLKLHDEQCTVHCLIFKNKCLSLVISKIQCFNTKPGGYIN